MTRSDTRENWLSILTTSLTLEPLSLDATSTSKASCKKGRGVEIGDEGGMEKREALEVHRGRNKN